MAGTQDANKSKETFQFFKFSLFSSTHCKSSKILLSAQIQDSKKFSFLSCVTIRFLPQLFNAFFFLLRFALFFFFLFSF